MTIADGEPSDREGDVRVPRNQVASAVIRSRTCDPPEASAGAFGTAIPITVAVRWMVEVVWRRRILRDALDAEAFMDHLVLEGVGFSSEVLT
jgi:hypothetical protein